MKQLATIALLVAIFTVPEIFYIVIVFHFVIAQLGRYGGRRKDNKERI